MSRLVNESEDADLSNYFDSTLHAKRLTIVAKRMVDGDILRLIKQSHKASVIGDDADGTRKSVGGGKANRTGTPQGVVITATYTFWIGPGNGSTSKTHCRRT